MSTSETLRTHEQACEYFRALGYPISTHTLRAYRSRGIGPRVDRWLGKRPLYAEAELRSWIEGRATINTVAAE